MAKKNSKERMMKWRQKLKENPEELQKHYQKERERDRLRRKDAKSKEQASNKLAIQKRHKETERKRRYREKLAARKNRDGPTTIEPLVTADSSPLGSYACIQTLSKAVKRLKQVLPSSPTKKDAVIRKLIFDNCGKDDTLQAIWKPQRKKTAAHKLPENHVKAVKEFYERDDISRQSPGIKDVKTVKDPISGDKVKCQRRYMNMTVREAYAFFLIEIPLIKIKLAKFYELRPPYVSLTSDIPHNVCVCKYHANVNFIVEVLSNKVSGFPNSGTILIEDLACNVQTEECMRGLCDDCSDIDLRRKLIQNYNMHQTLSWRKWVDLDGRPKVVTTEGTMEEIILELNSLLPRFKAHVYVKRMQSITFTEAKANVRKDEVVLQVDFAENYAVISQDEIQSAHWSHSQITIFTACAWLSEKRSCSFAVVSDVLNHDKHAVFAFIKKIITVLREDAPDLKTVKIFSDGAASQFKNRFTVSNLCFSVDDLGIETEWHFFATSHGKGAVDGIGGIVKRAVWTLVKQRKVVINDATEFAAAARTVVKNINILQLTQSEIEVNIDKLEKRWKNAMAIEKIQSHHFFKGCGSQDELQVGFTSRSATRKCRVFKWAIEDVYSEADSDASWSDSELLPLSSLCAKVAPFMPNDITPGLFLIIEVPHETSSTAYKYVGIVQSPPGNDECQVLFLKSVGNGKKIFKTNEEDVSFVCIQQIISILPTPKLNNVRGSVFYEFADPVNIHEQ